MEKNIALVLYYNKQTRFSFNALVGALETDEYFDNLPIYFISRENELISGLGTIINKHEEVIVGISFCTPQLWETYRLIRDLREKYKNKPLFITGGPHPTGDPIGTLRMGFDVVIRGEGEETLIELLKKIDNNETYSTVKGIAFLDDEGEYCYTGRRPPIDLDRYPPFAVKHNRFGYIEITRGCPYFCYFCQTPYLFGGQIRHRSIEVICKYVQIMKNRNLTFLRFIAPSAFSYGSLDGKKLNISRLERLLSDVSEIFDSGKVFLGSFPSEVRPKHVTEETIDLVLKYAHNDNLIIGAQSGSQRVLDLCHRGHTVEDVYNSVELTLKKGLNANVDFVFGLPEENEEDIELTIKVMSDLVKMEARIHAHTFMPLPSTPFKNAPAGKIDKNIRKMIKKLISKDIIYGNWREQEKVAEKIATYFKTGKL
ncbi:TIGR04013 family B12-binding domain/radical SAM domain-containing protein [Candidatus Borrarchaeum sp.]|uniref:TIGR04013 family B12-binding domain/radical SAM domain-containing protein n=1 Tax=Candidatus Borrarchaeum sp. TaxID=2846742 RepID=UPI00257C8636|nr:TIGR04013 family B12-binding domain/radical SAM domain-containing protein [Candidatus Borrarchaeum sp.]